ncbi:MAG: hypothetical protein EKK33_02130 [Bradyrhizobiaceae bacterium]|nr:MAG: hypothetical protein EKK33_02130 [Bradyrhizobiaceae bacterium]
MNFGRRNKLLWLGSLGENTCASECASRALQLEMLEVPALTALHRVQAKGLIVAFSNGCATPWLNDTLRDLLHEAACHGIRSFIVCSIYDSTAVANALKFWGLNDSRVVDIELQERQASLIERVARLKDEPAASDSLVISGDEALTDEERILLRRSFSDCSTVKLVQQSTGTAKVYCAFANLLNSRAGPIPLPFFVKFDKAKKIIRELDNYRECTTLHVPFNQRPNLDEARCLLGSARGVIAGNFIEQSEALQEVVDRGAGRTPLHSLFEGALRGWRRQAFYGSEYVAETNILHRMGPARPSRYPIYRRKMLHKRRAHHGPDCASFKELERLLNSLPPIRYRFGMTHGDLHGQNVRVAGSDAILLDFASVDQGPLTVDPATLDVSLMLDTRLISGEEWRRVASETYTVDALTAPSVPPRPENPCANLLDALQYVRQMAFGVQLTPYEYPCMIALQLLRKSSYRGSDDEQDERRVFAYWLADRLITDVARRIQVSIDRDATLLKA